MQMIIYLLFNSFCIKLKFNFFFFQKTGARIKIFSNVAPQSTDRVIQIIGEPDKCVDSIREIITLIKSVCIYFIFTLYIIY